MLKFLALPCFTTSLHLADDLDIVKLLIAKGADVNAKNNDGNTPLHLADDPNVIKLLIAKGANVNAKNNFGRNP